MGCFHYYKTVLILILSIFQQINGQCVDEKGYPEDWSIMYKLPKNSEELKPKDFIEDGLGYMYLTSKSQKNGWIKSDLSVKDVNSIPGRILSPIYGMKNDSELFHMFYNDEHPEGNTSFSLGHTKGIYYISIFFYLNISIKIMYYVPKYPLFIMTCVFSMLTLTVI